MGKITHEEELAELARQHLNDIATTEGVEPPPISIFSLIDFLKHLRKNENYKRANSEAKPNKFGIESQKNIARISKNR